MALPATMKAINLNKPAGPAGTVTFTNGSTKDLTFNPSQPMPSPSPTQALIRVHAVAVTPYELTWGFPPQSEPRVPCHDIAGTIVSAPANSGFAPGDRVFGLLDYMGQGGMAEYTVGEPEYLVKIPEGLDFVEAASVSRSALTVWQAMRVQGGGLLKEGMKVLVTGATGAVGRYAIQMIKHFVGKEGKVIALGGKGSEGLKALGADVVVNYRETKEWDEAVKKEGPVDLIFDCVGKKTLEKALALVKDGGAIVTIGSPPPDVVHVEGWNELKERNVNGIFFIVGPQGEQLAQIAALISKGVVKPSVALVVDLSEKSVRDGWDTALNGGFGGTLVVKVL
ncbi:GroES-like protein [Venustampulla echinocandica]|uniref:GroES-like protein n=1 Tax=Venustampulla echinocandica TaxID=2656787 RepID=A0A370TNJ2_9HELO|nr:GroES-like protein [Venustampulla echinocandica]RDL37092.1 GroES-like protein [Venustampulla echinocandica]